MQFQEARLQSFSNGGSLKPKGRSRTKTAAPSSWPLSPSKFPNLTPENLSQAGYYYSPTTEDVDQCGCFLCDSKLGGWEEEDDPFEEHWRRGDCAWATAVCSILVDERQGAKSGKKAGKVRIIYDDADRLPQSTTMVKARIKTYAKWWPNPNRGWLPTPATLSNAGFVYTPTEQDEDCVTCFYCDYSTVGWEPTDDPWEIHRKKRPNCSFFKAKLAGSVAEEEVVDEVISATTRRPASRSTKTTKSIPKPAPSTTRRTTRKTVQPSVAEQSEAETEPELEVSVDPPPLVEEQEEMIQTVQKSKSKPRVTSAARGRKTVVSVEPEPVPEPEILDIPSEVDEIAQPIQPEPISKPPAKRATRATVSRKTVVPKSTTVSAAKRGKKVEDVATETEAETIAVPPARATRIAAPKTRTRGTVTKAGLASSASSNASSVASGSDDVRDTVRSRTNGRIKPAMLKPRVPVRTRKAAPSSVTASETESEGDGVATVTEDESEADVVANMVVEVEPQEDIAERMRMIDQGAKEARSVMETLDQPTPRATITSRRLGAASAAASPLPTASALPLLADESVAESNNEIITLTDEQTEMTVVEYVRAMYEAKHRAMKEDGEAKIRLWQERAQGAREIIEGIRCRDE